MLSILLSQKEVDEIPELTDARAEHFLAAATRPLFHKVVLRIPKKEPTVEFGDELKRLSLRKLRRRFGMNVVVVSLNVQRRHAFFFRVDVHTMNV